MHFLQHSTHFSKTRCRPLITSKFLAQELPFHGWKSPEIAWGEIWTVWRMFLWGSTDPLFPSRTQNSIQISPHAISGLFQPTPRQEISKWSTVCSTFSRSGWSVVRSASLSTGGISKKIDRHCTSTKFRLGVIRWVHELFKWPSYIYYVLRTEIINLNASWKRNTVLHSISGLFFTVMSHYNWWSLCISVFFELYFNLFRSSFFPLKQQGLIIKCPLNVINLMDVERIVLLDFIHRLVSQKIEE
jgi:hypothetical protein